jgi:IS30 family transposase
VDTHATHGLLGFGHDTAARERRDCTHPGTPHRHGTRVAYVADGCRCTPCRAANRAAERHRTAAMRVGCWQPYVDPGPARARLKLLREHGVGLDQIAKIANTPKSTVRRLLREPAVSPVRIRTETADRLLAVQPSPEHVAPKSQIDAGETLCRIEMLVEAGHSIPELARALGKSSVSLRRTLNRRTVTAQTAVSVRNLYDRINPDGLEAQHFRRRARQDASTASDRLTG